MNTGFIYTNADHYAQAIRDYNGNPDGTVINGEVGLRQIDVRMGRNFSASITFVVSVFDWLYSFSQGNTQVQAIGAEYLIARAGPMGTPETEAAATAMLATVKAAITDESLTEVEAIPGILATMDFRIVF